MTETTGVTIGAVFVPREHSAKLGVWWLNVVESVEFSNAVCEVAFGPKTAHTMLLESSAELSFLEAAMMMMMMVVVKGWWW